MLPSSNLDVKVSLEREPLRFCEPRLALINDLGVKVPEELRNVLEHLDSGEVLPNAAPATHPKLGSFGLALNQCGPSGLGGMTYSCQKRILGLDLLIVPGKLWDPSFGAEGVCVCAEDVPVAIHAPGAHAADGPRGQIVWANLDALGRRVSRELILNRGVQPGALADDSREVGQLFGLPESDFATLPGNPERVVGAVDFVDKLLLDGWVGEDSPEACEDAYRGGVRPGSEDVDPFDHDVPLLDREPLGVLGLDEMLEHVPALARRKPSLHPLLHPLLQPLQEDVEGVQPAAAKGPDEPPGGRVVEPEHLQRHVAHVGHEVEAVVDGLNDAVDILALLEKTNGPTHG